METRAAADSGQVILSQKAGKVIKVQANEIQIMEGDQTPHGMGAVINETPAPYEAYNGVGKWNAYDIVFRAARFADGQLTEKPMVSMYFNGQKSKTKHH